MKNNLFNLVAAIVCIAMALLLAFGCSKRIVQKSNSSADSSSIRKSEAALVDTGRSGSYTRLTGWLPVGSFKGGVLNPFSTGRISPGVEMTKREINDRVMKGYGTVKPGDFDPASWPSDVFVKYLMSLPDGAVPGQVPFVFEQWSNEQKGLTTTSKTSEKKDMSEKKDDKKTERQTPLPWVAGLVLVILGIFLIIWMVPRVKK